MLIKTWDCDGVIYFNKDVTGFRPEPNDIIITGRSFEEEPETARMLALRCINNKVYYNPLKFDEKTRESSGHHKANTIKALQSIGFEISCHVEDDPVQAAVVREKCPDVNLILITHNLTNMENVRHL